MMSYVWFLLLSGAADTVIMLRKRHGAASTSSSEYEHVQKGKFDWFWHWLGILTVGLRAREMETEKPKWFLSAATHTQGRHIHDWKRCMACIIIWHNWYSYNYMLHMALENVKEQVFYSGTVRNWNLFLSTYAELYIKLTLNNMSKSDIKKYV